MLDFFLYELGFRFGNLAQPKNLPGINIVHKVQGEHIAQIGVGQLGQGCVEDFVNSLA